MSNHDLNVEIYLRYHPHLEVCSMLLAVCS
uniref:Uncharacterized protein n=1 Tax=Arundo donax TaxID=35708 RepID=A0A0A8YIM1_ARUDO